MAALVAASLAACSGGSNGSSPLPTTQNQPSNPTQNNSPGAADYASQSAAVSFSDTTAAASASHFQYHVMKVSKSNPTGVKPQTEYPMDMYFHGGQVIASAAQHALYVSISSPAISCTNVSSCWGAPMTFLKDMNATLASSTGYMHLLDQYAGSTAANRYPTSSNVNVTYGPIYKDSEGGYTLGESDMLSILHAGVAALVKNGTVPTNPGYAHEFHIFIPKGIDHCLDAGYCYSPDFTGPWVFCAYHGSTDFSDLGHVVFSVEPYQNVPGCQSNPAWTNTTGIGILANSTDNVLSHELFESISDPDPTIAAAYFNMYGMEIGDVCQPWVFPLTVGTHNYSIQTEYSNTDHGCDP